jgi:hypothetical protein
MNLRTLHNTHVAYNYVQQFSEESLNADTYLMMVITLMVCHYSTAAQCNYK